MHYSRENFSAKNKQNMATRIGKLITPMVDGRQQEVVAFAGLMLTL